VSDSKRGDWWCPECKVGLSPSRVTNDERCDTCGTPVTVGGEGLEAEVKALMEIRTEEIDRLEARALAAESSLAEAVGALRLLKHEVDRQRELLDAKDAGWNEGVEATIERLRSYWDDGPQGNANEAAELVMLRDLLLAAPPAEPWRSLLDDPGATIDLLNRHADKALAYLKMNGDDPLVGDEDADSDTRAVIWNQMSALLSDAARHKPAAEQGCPECNGTRKRPVYSAGEEMVAGFKPCPKCATSPSLKEAKP